MYSLTKNKHRGGEGRVLKNCFTYTQIQLTELTRTKFFEIKFESS